MIVVKTKQWGNSIGLILPKEFAEEKGIKVGDEVLVEVEKKGNVLKELAGALPFKEPTEKLLKEFRKDFESRYM